MEEVEAFCIHCNSAIVASDIDSSDVHQAAHDHGSSDQQPATISADMQRSKSTGAVASNQTQLPAAARSHARRVSSDGHHSSGFKRSNGQLNAHHARTVASKIRRNHSSGKLTSVGAHALANNISNKSRIAALKPLTIAPLAPDHHHQVDSAAPLVANDTAPPAWMSLYCSLACKEADEMASMVTYASLADRHKGIPAYKHSMQSTHSPHSTHGAASRSSPSICASSASPRRSTFSHSYGSSNGFPSSPLVDDSEGIEFDWSDQHTDIRRNGSSGRLSHTNNRDSVDSSYSASRGHFDNAETFRARFTRVRRASSRARGSTDSLASLSEEPLGESEPAMSLEQTYFSSRHRQSRPSSALNGNLRAMTPIHSLDSPTSETQQSPDAVTKLDRHATVKGRASANSDRESVLSSSMLLASNAERKRPTKFKQLGEDRDEFSQASLLKPLSRATLAESKSSATLSVSADTAADALMRRSRPSSSSLAYYSGSPSSAGSASVRSTGSIALTIETYSTKRQSSLNPQSSDSATPPVHSQTPTLAPRAVPFARPASNQALSTTYAVSSGAPGRSPPLSRAARLSASFDAMYGVLQNHGSHHATHRQTFSNTPMALATSLQRTPSSLLSHYTARSDARYDMPPHHLQTHTHRRSQSTADFLLEGSEASSPPSPRLYTPDYDGANRNTYIHRSHHAKQIIPPNRSRTSFNWDHLPAFVPKYAPMDLEKINRSRYPSHIEATSQDSDLQNQTHTGGQRKRLFYFPEPEEHP